MSSTAIVIAPKNYTNFIPKANAVCNTHAELVHPESETENIRIGFKKEGNVGECHLEYIIKDKDPNKKRTLVISSLIDICPQNRIEVFFNNTMVSALNTREPNGIQTKTNNIHILVTSRETNNLKIKYHKTGRQIRDSFMLLFGIYLQ